MAAAARNPVCNMASMVGITDIPDWCFFEAYGDQSHYTEAPSAEDLSRFHQMSPISHISKVKPQLPFSSTLSRHLMIPLVYLHLQVKTPTLFLLGTKDLRVPISNGFQVRSLFRRSFERICNLFKFADSQNSLVMVSNPELLFSI